MSEESMYSLIDSMREILYPQPKLDICNKEDICKILNISRPTLDRYIKDGKIPKGHHHPGFKTLVWDKSIIVELKNKL